MKKRMCLLLLLVLCLFASLGTAETERDFTYSIRSGSAAVTAYTGSAEELTVPDTLGGYPVTSISYCAFRNCTSLVQITLPDGVTSIGSNAFQGCSSLMQLDLPDSLATIGTHAFYGCANLTQLTIPDSLVRLHPYAFYGCSAIRLCSPKGPAARTLTSFGYSFTDPAFPLLALKAYDEQDRRTFSVADCDESAAAIIFPASVTAIDRNAFYGCALLTEITIPEGITHIPASAFEGCASLAQVTLPASVTSIDPSAFARCAGITFIAPAGSAAPAFVRANAGSSFVWRAPQ